ncbi:MAG: PQQ-binding-like beta-propeller repeat protein [Myxococcales bacterium]|nr:PQQ-binding-like beta-propeller repeat protein [Myxococcales bacterium]MBK7198645.1 PQQ-binding-like beta-propeller repeat protein [Myxococcales bacterium]
MSLARVFAPVALAAVLAAGCGPKTVYGLSSDDNNAERLGAALAKRAVAKADAPLNALGKPLVFAAVGGAKKQLVAFDAGAGSALWTVDADVQSRVAVAGELVVAKEAGGVVVRKLADGSVRAKLALAGELVGVTTDGERVYVVVQAGTGPKPVWSLIAYSGDGSQLWQNDSPGALGAPVAQGGLVLSPFLKQWLAVLDARTGAQLTRVRGLDEEISELRVTATAAFFGSKAGVFRLDDKAATGSRAGATYGTVTLPKELATADYGHDAFDPVQAGYSAFDRRRILWRADPTADGPFRWSGELIAVHFFRFVFGLTPAGEFRWAYSHPRVELVASEHAGPVIVAVAGDGTLVALDAATGAVRASAKLEVGGPVLGATIDCDGWAPSDAGEAPSTVTALATIARDRDARFEAIKQYAVATMAKLEGADVTRDLVALVVDPRTPIKLHDTVADLLVARKDPTGLPALIDALAVRPDFLTNTQPVGLIEVGRAIGALGGVSLPEAEQARAMAALELQAFDPATAAPARLELVRALIAIGHGRERARLKAELVQYRADPGFAAEADLVVAMTAAVAAGGPEDREVVRWIAADARSHPAVAAAAQAALQPASQP